MKRTPSITFPESSAIVENESEELGNTRYMQNPSASENISNTPEKSVMLRRSARLAHLDPEIRQDIGDAESVHSRESSIQSSIASDNAQKSKKTKRKYKSELDRLFEDLNETELGNIDSDVEISGFRRRTRSQSSTCSINETVAKSKVIKMKNEASGCSESLLVEKTDKRKKPKKSCSSPIKHSVTSRNSEFAGKAIPNLETLKEVEEIEETLETNPIQGRINESSQENPTKMSEIDDKTNKFKRERKLEVDSDDVKEKFPEASELRVVNYSKRSDEFSASSSTIRLADYSAEVISKNKKESKFSPKKQKICEILTSSNLDDSERKKVNAENDIKSSDMKELWPLINDSKFLWESRNDDKMLEAISKSYRYIDIIDKCVKNLTQNLLKLNEEGIWQQISYGNEKFLKYAKKQKDLFHVKMNFPNKESVNIMAINESAKLSENEFEMDEENTEIPMDRNLMDLEDSSEEDDDEQENDEAAGRQRKYPKSKVDDKFFSLAEMDDILDKQEANESDEGFLDNVELDDEPIKYRYHDFYDDPEDKSTLRTEKKKDKKVSFFGLPSKDDQSKNIRYAGDLSDEDDDLLKNRILLGKNDESTEESEFLKSQSKLRERIAKLEESNLAPVKWDLSGEVTAAVRPENAMLEQHLDFERAAKLPPLITVDTTSKLEAIIIQRIKDKIFDDVVRVVRDSADKKKYKSEVDEKIVKKSLTEVYEEQYQKDVQNVPSEKNENEKHKEIEKMMSELFKKLDALSHYKFMPPPVQPEIRIINNMASLQKEEVGPLASTDDCLMAPEEIKPSLKGVYKGKDERDVFDRARERRKKKKMQKAKNKIGQTTILGNENKITKDALKKGPKKKLSKKDSIKSGVFFNKLQQSVFEEVKRKSSSKSKEKVKDTKSSKYML